VFAGRAARGKSSTGWFFSFKLHIVINHVGALLDIKLTAGNLDGRKALASRTGNWFGKLFADKDYVAQWLTQWCQERGFEWVTKVRKNMKPPKHSAFDRAILSSRSLAETVFDELKNLCQIEHTRHRSPMGFAAPLLAGILAYCLFPNKPQLSLQQHLPSGLISN
jgi:transposase